MSLNKFKTLIKECIREVIREEKILLENNSNNYKTSQLNQIKSVDKYIKPSIVDKNLNPIQQLLEETKQSMTAQDIQEITSGQSQSSPLKSKELEILTNDHSTVNDGVPNYSKLWEKMK